MEKIKLTFLGTSNAIPTASRNHTAIHLSFKNENILIDCGEGTQRQFRIAKLSPAKLTKILITHWHGDHILGLPGLFQTLAMSNFQKTLHLYGPKGTKHFIKIIEALVARFKIRLQVHEITNTKSPIFQTEDYQILASPMHHKVPALAYSFKIKDKRRLDKSKLKKLKLPNSPILKNLQQGKSVVFNKKKIKASQVSEIEKGRKITFILDTIMNSNTTKIAKDSTLLVSESSFSENESDQAAQKMHLTAKQAATIAKQSKSKSLVLTHISQRYEHNTSPILKEAKAIFPNTKIVNDLDVIEI
jgi:ribonuclease Z